MAEKARLPGRRKRSKFRLAPVYTDPTNVGVSIEEVASYVSQMIPPEFTQTIQTLISKREESGAVSRNHQPVETSTAANSMESLACPSTGSGQEIELIVNLNQPDSCKGTTFVCLNVYLPVRPSVCPLTFYIFDFFSSVTGPIKTKLAKTHYRVKQIQVC